MSGSKRGLQLYKLMEMGELVPVEVVLDLLSEVGNLILFSKFDKKTRVNNRLTSLYWCKSLQLNCKEELNLCKDLWFSNPYIFAWSRF